MTLVKKKEKPLKISGYLLKGWSSRDTCNYLNHIDNYMVVAFLFFLVFT